MERPEDKTILVVDDEPNVREYLTTVLQDAGFNVVTAGDGAEALDIIRENPPDFISLDLIMPRKSGHKLLYGLRKHKRWSRIPVLIVTAVTGYGGDPEPFKQFISTRKQVPPPDGYLAKPIDKQEFLNTVAKALS